MFITLALELLTSSVLSERQLKSILQLYQKAFSESTDNYESEYVERDAADLNRDLADKTSFQQSRIQSFQHNTPLQLNIASPGLLETLHFVEGDQQANPSGEEEVEVDVRAVGVNFRDCLIALGQFSDSKPGSECAGYVTRVGSKCTAIAPGDRFATCSLDTFKSYARCRSDRVHQIPDSLSFAEAAAIPTTFVTVYHGLCHIAHIQTGESILIHSGAGGTGQAAIRIAKLYDADIFVTVGSDEKKRLLMVAYGIPEDHIFYSRNTSVADGIKLATQGRGVDIVLNSLTGESLVASWECIAPFGRFLEIGKKDIYSRGSLPMFPFAQNVTFSDIDLASLSVQRPELLQKSFRSVMRLFLDQKLQPASPIHTFPVSEVEKAFRYMQTGKNVGKIVVTIQPEDRVLTVLNTKPAYQFNPDATYIISGGLGGVGRSIARWMCSRGARHLLLLSRSGPRSPSAKELLEELTGSGVQVEAPSCNVTRIASVRAVLQDCKDKMPPIKGCLQGSMVLKGNPSREDI
ncbi:hypothetical protein MMC30_006914 [Trapelia coarctata]|nr:hypothetical protein [Trapelia coarctata]